MQGKYDDFTTELCKTCDPLCTACDLTPLNCTICNAVYRGPSPPSCPCYPFYFTTGPLQCERKYLKKIVN